MDLKNWQYSNYNKLQHKKINNIVLPETHDSGAYKLNLKIPLSHDDLLDSIREFRDLGGRLIIERWTLAQDKDFYQQLKSGIRSFDWRVTYHNGEYILAHSYATVTVENVIEQMNKFFDENPKEFIIIRVQPDNKIHKMTSNDIKKFWEHVYKNDAFKKRIYLKTTFPKYSKMIQFSKNVVFIEYYMYAQNFIGIHGGMYKQSFRLPEFEEKNKAIIQNKKWLKEYFPRTDNNNDKFLLYNTNLYPSNVTIVKSISCMLYPLKIFCFIFILCVIAAYYIYRYGKYTSPLYILRKFILNPFILFSIIWNILYLLFLYVPVCTHTFNIFKSLYTKEPQVQNEMINILKKQRHLAKELSSVAMDFPTDENIKYIINLNLYS